MAGVLIATALGASAATAAAVGGGVAAVSALTSAGKSFSEANKAKKRGMKAEREAKKAMAEARKRLDVNVMEQLSIQKEPYELAREASLVAGTQGLQAGVEGDERGAAATAGRVFMGQQDAQSKIRSAMGQELQGIQQQIVDEASRLKDLGMGLSLEEAAGAQKAARDAQEDRAAYLEGGFGALLEGAKLGMEYAPLYGAPQDVDALNPRRSGENSDMLTRRQRKGFLDAEAAYDAQQGQLGQSVFQDTDFSSVGGVNTIGSRIGTGGQLSPEQLEALKQRILQDPNITGGFPR